MVRRKLSSSRKALQSSNTSYTSTIIEGRSSWDAQTNNLDTSWETDT